MKMSNNMADRKLVARIINLWESWKLGGGRLRENLSELLLRPSLLQEKKSPSLHITRVLKTNAENMTPCDLLTEVRFQPVVRRPRVSFAI
jgi:hypothetical protein